MERDDLPNPDEPSMERDPLAFLALAFLALVVFAAWLMVAPFLPEGW